MKGKSLQRAPVRLNVVVQRELRWLMGEVATAPPLSFLDPALDEWRRRDADIILY
jgi:hypothetical protein